jgi:anti-sigma factor RsiW
MRAEVDRVIAALLRDQARAPTPRRLLRKLARLRCRTQHWLVLVLAALAGASLAPLVMLVLGPAPAPAPDPAVEAVGDHLRVLEAHDLGAETSLSPSFAGKLDFVPPIAFLGDDEFQLRGGDVAIFLGHQAAAFLYSCRSHAISLFVFETGGVRASERTFQGFHVSTWERDGLGFALVSDLDWGELRTLRGRVLPRS